MAAPPPSPRDELREIARGVARHVRALDEEGFVAPPAAARRQGAEHSPARGSAVAAPPAAAAAEPCDAPTPRTPATVAATAALPLESETDDPTRRSAQSRRGDGAGRSPSERAAALAAIAARVNACTLCRLCNGRTNGVPGEGSPSARVMFVGEGPGATEDEMGRPFVGRAGQLLTKIIESGMGLKREDVFIANVVKCRPPENRDPQPDEVAMCLPYLHRQIEVVDPEVIIPLGRHSMRELAGTGERDGITKVRGQVYRRNGRAVIPTFHPAYLLRSPGEKPKVWHDIQLAMKELGLPVGR